MSIPSGFEVFSSMCGFGILSKMAAEFSLHIVPPSPHGAGSVLSLRFLSKAKKLRVLSFPALTVHITNPPTSLLRALDLPARNLGFLHLLLSMILGPSVYLLSLAWTPSVSMFTNTYRIMDLTSWQEAMRDRQEWGVCVTSES